MPTVHGRTGGKILKKPTSLTSVLAPFNQDTGQLTLDRFLESIFKFSTQKFIWPTSISVVTFLYVSIQLRNENVYTSISHQAQKPPTIAPFDRSHPVIPNEPIPNPSKQEVKGFILRRKS